MDPGVTLITTKDPDACGSTVIITGGRAATDLEFTLQKRDATGAWIPVDFENIGISAQEFLLDLTDQVSEVVYPSVPLAEIEGSLLRVQARLMEP